MEIEQIRCVLGWCAIINYAFLLLWFAVFAMKREWLRRLNARLFSLPGDTFDTVHYALMGVFKLGILVFNLAPYIAMSIVA